MANMIGDALSSFNKWSSEGQNASNLAYILDQLGSNIAPNNPFAGIGSRMAQGNVATQEVKRQNAANQEFIRNLMGTLTSKDQNGPTKISATTDEAGNINYKIDGVSSSGQAAGAVTPSGQGPSMPTPVSSAPVDMSILPMEMITSLANRNQKQLDLRTELMAKLAGRTPAEQTLPLLWNGEIVEVPISQADDLMAAGATMMNAISLKELREAKTPQEIENIKSEILRRKNQTEIEGQKAASTINLQNAKQAKIEAETNEISANAFANRENLIARAGRDRSEMIATMGEQGYLEENMKLQRDLADSLIAHRKYLETPEGRRRPMTALEEAQFNKMRIALPYATNEVVNDTSKPYPVRYEAISSYNKVTDSSLGYYGTVPIERWGPDVPGEIKQIYLPYNKILGRVMTMEDVRNIAADKGVSIEEVVRYIDELSQKGKQ